MYSVERNFFETSPQGNLRLRVNLSPQTKIAHKISLAITRSLVKLQLSACYWKETVIVVLRYGVEKVLYGISLMANYQEGKAPAWSPFQRRMWSHG